MRCQWKREVDTSFAYVSLSVNCSRLRNSHPEMFCKKDLLKNFAKNTRKQLCHSLFFESLRALACNFIKKESLAQVFSCKFFDIFKNTFFIEHLLCLLLSCGCSVSVKENADRQNLIHYFKCCFLLSFSKHFKISTVVVSLIKNVTNYD